MSTNRGWILHAPLSLLRHRQTEMLINTILQLFQYSRCAEQPLDYEVGVVPPT